MPVHKRMGDVIERLTSIQGHVLGVKRMAEEGRGCEDILIQLGAVKAAVEQTARILLEDHLECCIVEGIEQGDAVRTMNEFKRALGKIL
jgi:DNA-binding FrmR family transcriptional regulator